MSGIARTLNRIVRVQEQTNKRTMSKTDNNNDYNYNQALGKKYA